MRRLRSLYSLTFALAAGVFVLLAGTAWAAPVEVLWLGHSATRITTVEGKVIVIDPFLRQNPSSIILSTR